MAHNVYSTKTEANRLKEETLKKEQAVKITAKKALRRRLKHQG